MPEHTNCVSETRYLYSSWYVMYETGKEKQSLGIMVTARMPPGACTEGTSAGIPGKDKHCSTLIFEGIKYPLVRCPYQRTLYYLSLISCKTTDNRSHLLGAAITTFKFTPQYFSVLSSLSSSKQEPSEAEFTPCLYSASSLLREIVEQVLLLSCVTWSTPFSLK